jgi:hypothetical protein
VDKLHDSRAQYPQHLLTKAADTVRKRYKRIFAKAKPAHPLDEKTSLNGIAGVRFIDPFKKKTGQGLPRRGPKSSVILDDGKTRFYTPEARESVRFVAHCLSEHINPGIIADINLKDEVKKIEKDIRGFASMPFAYNDIMRRGSLPVFKVIQENSILTGIAIGVDATLPSGKCSSKSTSLGCCKSCTISKRSTDRIPKKSSEQPTSCFLT